MGLVVAHLIPQNAQDLGATKPNAIMLIEIGDMRANIPVGMGRGHRQFKRHKHIIHIHGRGGGGAGRRPQRIRIVGAAPPLVLR